MPLTIFSSPCVSCGHCEYGFLSETQRTRKLYCFNCKLIREEMIDAD